MENTKKFSNDYTSLILNVLDSDIEMNNRTGVQTKVIDQPTVVSINLNDRILPTVGTRKTFPKSAAAEVAWFIKGDQDISFIKKYAPMWDKFSETIPSVNGNFEGVVAAYGHRWRNHFGRDQLKDAIAALKKDPSNRRIYISAWDSSTDGLLDTESKNVPCPVGYTLSIVKGKLNSAIMLRSSDLFVGLPYDIMGHALLMNAISHSLNVELGTLHATLAHPHLYECHFDMALESVIQKPILPAFKMPNFSIEDIEKNPDLYVETVLSYSKEFEWPSFNPKPLVVDGKKNRMVDELSANEVVEKDNLLKMLNNEPKPRKKLKL